jgi:hypothetical protein
MRSATHVVMGVEVVTQLGPLCLALAHHEVAVDPAVRLGALGVEVDEAVEGALEVFGVEPVEAHGLHRCLGEHLTGDREHERAVAGIFEVVAPRHTRRGSRAAGAARVTTHRGSRYARRRVKTIASDTTSLRELRCLHDVTQIRPPLCV